MGSLRILASGGKRLEVGPDGSSKIVSQDGVFEFEPESARGTAIPT